MEEIWKDIEGYEGLYQVSNLGRVKSLNYEKERILKLRPQKGGYYRVCLSKKCVVKDYLIHRLVYKTFIGDIPSDMQIGHLDENVANNRLDNLQLMTCLENINWGTHNLKVSMSRSKKIICVETSNIYLNAKIAEKETGINRVSIGYCCHGKYKTAGGYHWQYIE